MKRNLCFESCAFIYSYKMSEEEHSNIPEVLIQEHKRKIPRLECQATLPTHFACSRSKINKKNRIKPDEELLVRRLFEKKFYLKNNNGHWNLPENLEHFRDNIWKIPELQALKAEMNEVKSKLNDFDMEDWHRHTSSHNKAGNILWKLKNDYAPEFVTQAWCKFYEIVMSFPILSPKVTKHQQLNSIHLCEAPGAFIASLNHFLKVHHPHVEWNWRATTLNPYYEGNSLSSMINDDRFIFHTLRQWIFGCDYTGDIMDMDNILHIVKETRELGEIMLVTADGSIDCQDNPAEQECVVSLLHYYETFTALSILSQGGSFLLKIFTVYEAQTVCLLYLLCCAFHQVHLFKPATSKEGNSEVYVICIDYRGRQHIDPSLKELKNFLESNIKTHAMFSLESIPQNFIEQVLLLSKMFKNFQVEAIQHNIHTYGAVSNNYNIKHIRYLTAQHFMERYKLERLCNSKEIVGNKKLKETVMINLDNHIRKGSFTDKLQQKDVDKLSHLLNEIVNMDIPWTVKNHIQWLKFQRSVIHFKIITGKTIRTVRSSKFCSRRLLQIWNNIREAVHISGSSCIGEKEYDIRSKDSFHIIKNFINEEHSVSCPDLKVINIKTEYWSSLEGFDNDKVEKEALTEILECLNNMQTGENLLLHGYPLLTHFNVGIIYLLGNLFKKVGFINPAVRHYCLVFIGFQSLNEGIGQYLKEVYEMHTLLRRKEDENSVVAVVGIDQLCGTVLQSTGSGNSMRKCPNEVEYTETHTTFYHCVTNMNNIYLKEHISTMINHEMKLSVT